MSSLRKSKRKTSPQTLINQKLRKTSTQTQTVIDRKLINLIFNLSFCSICTRERMVKNNLGKEATTKKSVATPKKKISKQDRTVQSVPLQKNKLHIILKNKQSSQPSKSEIKQTTPKKKKIS
ncbi:hypothetical protein C5167_044277 [Papaver somniferum]|uniref:Uncharacterized protein n=1 Tax=Papaver somniferum TaxID=3469 RepID=A0A4Y7L875_PAPSO|nr:hypothetical protein C5167_044277 [Papaver somniferum]